MAFTQANTLQSHKLMSRALRKKSAFNEQLQIILFIKCQALWQPLLGFLTLTSTTKFLVSLSW